MRRLGKTLIAREGLADIKDDDRFKHLWTIGRSGTGKSTFLLNLVRQELNEAVLIIDPAGSFAETVAAMAPPERLILISKDQPMVINPLNRPGLDWSEIANEFAEAMNACVAATSSSLDSTVLMNELIRNAVRVLEGTNRNIEHMADLLNHWEVRQKYKTKSEYWRTFDDLDAHNVRTFKFREKIDSAKRVGSRLSAFYDNDILRPFTIGKNEFEVSRFVNNKNIVILNLSGFDNDVKIYLGILAIVAVKSYYNHKPTIGGDPLYLYVDEFHRFKVPFWEEMLSQARKYNISINLANQDLEQFSKSVLSSIMGNVYCKVAFACGHAEAVAIGNEFDLKPEDLKNLPKFTAVARIGNKNHKIKTFPPPDLPEHVKHNFMADEDDAWISC